MWLADPALLPGLALRAHLMLAWTAFALFAARLAPVLRHGQDRGSGKVF